MNSWVGYRIENRFTLLEWLGATDAGEMYLAGLAGGGRAAVFLSPAQPATAQDQVRSWETAAALDHPNIQRVIAFGRTDVDLADTLYLVTELTEETLSQIVPERRLTAGEAREMLKPVLDALNYLHGKGLVHGRLNPASIVVAEGRVKLSAQAICPAGSLRGVDDVIRIYDAPESKSEPLSPSGDVWSLGVSLLEALTQKVPTFVRSSGRDPLIPVDVPKPFGEIAKGCLRVDPARRFTLREIEQLLESGLPGNAPTGIALEPAPTAAEPISPEVASQAPAPVPALTDPEPARQPRLVAMPPRAAKKLDPEPQQATLPVQATLFEAAPEPEEDAGEIPESGQEQPFRRSMRLVDEEDQGRILSLPRRPVLIGAAAMLLVLIIGLVSSSHRGKRAAGAVQPQPGTSKTETADAKKLISPAAQPDQSRSVAPKSRVAEPTRGEVVSRVLPEIPARAARGIRGKVDVRVRASVDRAGNVAGVTIVSAGRSRYFAERAVEAARKWKFRSPRVDGRTVASTWELRFIFRKNHTDASAMELKG